MSHHSSPSTKFLFYSVAILFGAIANSWFFYLVFVSCLSLTAVRYWQER
ncbi:MAG: hypothetical protein HC890_00985 [Chloroflexaceae bacterium]|nr:hypothetical protein [Chloroflexaceae bacterium]